MNQPIDIAQDERNSQKKLKRVRAILILGKLIGTFLSEIFLAEIGAVYCLEGLLGQTALGLKGAFVVIVISTLIIVILHLAFEFKSMMNQHLNRANNQIDEDLTTNIVNAEQLNDDKTKIQYQQIKDIIQDVSEYLKIKAPKIEITNSQQINILITNNILYISEKDLSLTRDELEALITPCLYKQATDYNTISYMLTDVIIRLFQHFNNMKTQLLWTYCIVKTNDQDQTRWEDHNTDTWIFMIPIMWLWYPLKVLVSLPFMYMGLHIATKLQIEQTLKADEVSLLITHNPEALESVINTTKNNPQEVVENLYQRNLYFNNTHHFTPLEILQKHTGINPHTPKLPVDKLLLNALNTATSNQIRINNIQTINQK